MLGWRPVPAATGYTVYRDGKRIFTTSDPTVTTATVPAPTAAGADIFTIQALGASLWGQLVVGTRTSSCFQGPATCGYPDPTTVGVPPSDQLTPSGSITTATDGQVISGKAVTGTITVKNKNVTITGTSVTTTGGSGTAGIIIENGATGTHITNSTVKGAGTDEQDSIQSAVWNHYDMAGTVASGDVFYDESDPWEGSGTISNSYVISNGLADGAHYEDVYLSDGTLFANHDTLINPQEQTAVVFGDTNLGGGGPADNHLTITNSLLAGGGWMLYATSASTSVGTSTINISGNRFARCASAPVYDPSSGGTECSGGADAFGVHPYGGFFGVVTATYCPPTPGQFWSGNVWDDNSAVIGCG